MSSVDRSWMYARLTGGVLNPVFSEGVEQFIAYARTQLESMDKSKIRCPCRKCENNRYKKPDVVHRHLVKEGFVAHYHVWYLHGEFSYLSTTDESVEQEDSYMWTCISKRQPLQKRHKNSTCEPSSSLSSTARNDEQERQLIKQEQALAKEQDRLLIERERALDERRRVLAKEQELFEQYKIEQIQQKMTMKFEQIEKEVRQQMEEEARAVSATIATPLSLSNSDDPQHP